MRKRGAQFVSLLCLLLAGLLVIFLRRDVEPSYNGRTLSEWSISGGDIKLNEAEDAIRHIGTNSLPFVLRWVTAEPLAWRNKVDIECLNDADPAVATMISRMISGASHGKVISILNSALENPNDSVRAAASNALSRLDSKATYPPSITIP